MKMVFRWFGEGRDSVPLAYIRQIPGVDGIVGALYDTAVGEAWPAEGIRLLKDQAGAHALSLEVIESVNVHEDIKLGRPTRDRYIENYRLTLERLARFGVKVVCYNFMPVLDWFRTDLAHPLPDGSTAFFYEAAKVEALSLEEIVESIARDSRGFALPGWEKERLVELRSLFESYEGIGADELFENLGYFLDALMPTCEEYDIRLAIHPDDPPWPIFGLPRIVGSEEGLARILELADSPYNGLTLCSGSLGADPRNDIPAIVRRFSGMGRIHFAHVRNVRILPNGDYCESAHLSSEGSLDLYEIMKAYYETGFEGYIRPDHGRMIWGEEARPGYGLYDRALGIAYLNGLWEALQKGGAKGRRR
jgi:mannonate dehydratase